MEAGRQGNCSSRCVLATRGCVFHQQRPWSVLSRLILFLSLFLAAQRSQHFYIPEALCHEAAQALWNWWEDANTMGIFSGPFTTGSSTVRRRNAESFQGFLPSSLVLMQEEILLRMPSLKTVPVSVPWLSKVPSSWEEWKTTALAQHHQSTRTPPGFTPSSPKSTEPYNTSSSCLISRNFESPKMSAVEWFIFTRKVFS